MSNAKSRLRNAHSQKGSEQEGKPQLIVEQKQEPVIESISQKEPLTDNELNENSLEKQISEIVSEVSEEVATEEFGLNDDKPVKRRKIQVNKSKEIASNVKKIARKDIPISTYRSHSVQVNFGLYNKELLDWFRNFSQDNKDHDGIGINQSLFVELILDIIYYDLKLDAIGYNSYEELREDIMDKIKRLGD